MGYFIVDQLPDGFDEGKGVPIEVFEKCKGGKLSDERLDLWLGHAKVVQRIAYEKKMDPHKMRIIDHADKSVGYHCPLRIHLCGKWWDSPELRHIKYYFERMAHAKFLDIEFVTEK